MADLKSELLSQAMNAAATRASCTEGMSSIDAVNAVIDAFLVARERINRISFDEVRFSGGVNAAGTGPSSEVAGEAS